ncbi:hypothetical protein F0249_19505 [Vibrio sp. 03-59-1]|uniref:hypothetical protein n=1 Tax=Vibrio sp. 03-59-1 TaxID=2607607 RepID=UPI0014935F8D|nr:hypothetical protein [Vibrio sp. 03-59-1]NOH85968.1 hypothetical protein [Vibrio sp. 03-59-1]
MAEFNKLEVGQSKELTLVQKVSTLYGNSAVTRGLMMMLPIGGIIDAFVTMPSTKYAQERINTLIGELQSQLAKLESVVLSSDSEEQFMLLTSKACQMALTSRTETKIKWLATVLSNSVKHTEAWDETEAMLDFVASLTESHIVILKTISDLEPSFLEAFKGMRVAALEEKVKTGFNQEVYPIELLQELIPSINEIALKVYCADLIAKGLLADEGVGRWSGKPLTIIRATESTSWFLKWLENSA